MDFVKMHGLGNDYVVLDRRDDPAVPSGMAVRRLCDRHRGVGGDGVIVILPPVEVAAHARMRIFNRDGSDGGVCGNGLRCVGRLLFDRCGVDRVMVEIEGGVTELTRVSDEGDSTVVVEAMLPPPGRRLCSLPAEIPGFNPEDELVDREVASLGLDGVELPSDARLTLVSTGNPHAVCFTDLADGVDLDRIGALLQRHRWFPEGINFHLVRRLDDGSLRMRTWERGAGATMACGTGACAATAADRWSGGVGDAGGWTRVSLPGGALRIGMGPSAEGALRMQGDAVEVCRGTLATGWDADLDTENSP